MGHRILVVEDDTSMRENMVMFLETAGYQVTQAPDGETALALLLDTPGHDGGYAVVVTDIIMGHVDGIEVMEAAKRQDNPPEVILLTGHGSLETAMIAVRTHAFDYLLKPCRITTLLERVAAAVARHDEQERSRLESERGRKLAELANEILLEGPPPPAAAPPLGPSAALAVQPRAPAQHPRRPTAPAVPTLFLLKPSNAGIVTRQTRRLARRKRRSRLLVVLGGVLLLVAGVVWGLVLPDWWTWYRLEQDGATVTGTLSELSRSGEHYYAHYRFFTPQQDAASDVPHTGQQRVNAGSVDAIDASDAVSVTYLPDDPTVSRLARANPADTLRNQRTWLAGGLTGLVLVAFAASAIQRRPDKIVIRGQVVAASSTRDADGDHHLKLRCRFRAPTGRSFTFQASRIRNDITPDGVPKPGTPVAVYYRSDRSFTLL